MPKGSQNIRKYVLSTTCNGLEEYKNLYNLSKQYFYKFLSSKLTET